MLGYFLMNELIIFMLVGLEIVLVSRATGELLNLSDSSFLIIS